MGYPPENSQDSGISLTHPPRPTNLPPPRCQTPRRQAVRTAMFHGTRPGWIEVIAGVMFSGKSEERVRRFRPAASGLADRGVRVVLAGIDMDFRGLPFGPMPTLLAVAEIVDKLQAICVVCGGPASRNQRLVNGRPALWESPTIMVGGRESYEA